MLISALAFSGRHVPNPCVYCIFHRKIGKFWQNSALLRCFFQRSLPRPPLELIVGGFGCPLGALVACWGAPGSSFGPPWGSRGSSLGPLGGPWGPLWGLLGGPWAAFGCLWGEGGGLWGAFVSLWGALGSILGALQKIRDSSAPTATHRKALSENS